MKIVVLDKNTVTNGDVSLSPIEACGETVYYDVLSQDELPAAIGDADAVILNKARITAEIMDACKNLKYIGLFATGYNNIDTDAAHRRSITVCNAPGYSTDSVAQTVFSFILHFACSTGLYDRSVKQGDWVKANKFTYFPFPLTELAGKTLGIIGFGAIGSRVAGIGRAFGMNIISFTRSKKDVSGVRFVSLDEVLSQSDYLSLHCPLTPQTENLINSQTLSRMKKNAVLINTSRGAAVNEKDLCHALDTGVIAGAGIDVLATEPMAADCPYLHAKNLIITPHIGWASLETRKRLITLVAENISAFQNGSPKNTV